jgi:hypothetical protein
MKYNVLYDDGEKVLSNVSLEKAQEYVDEHRFDCFSRTLRIQKITMSEQEFLRRLGIVNDFLHYVEKTLNTTDIPIDILIDIIRNEIGLDMNKIGEDK